MAGPPCPLGNGQGHKPFIFNLGCSLVPSDVRPLGGSCICDRPYAPGKKALLGKGRWVELSSCVPGADPCQPAPSPSQQPQAWTQASWETWRITVLQMKVSRRESCPPSKTCRATNRQHAMRSDEPSDSAPWQGFAFENGYGEGNGTPLQCSCLENAMDGGAWWAPVHGVAKSRARLSDFTFTFHLHALEKEMATHSSVLAWRIPGMEEPVGLPSMGSHRVRHN